MTAWYCYRCPACGARWESQQPWPDREWCGCNENSSTFPVRDYRAEGANVARDNLRSSR